MHAANPSFRLLDACAGSARPRIAVFRALHLGEMLCAVPALRALRTAAPTAHITLIGLPWAASFVRRFSRYVDAHAAFPGFPGLPGQAADLARIPGFIAAMQAQRFDCALQMHGNGLLSNPLLRTFGAARNAGFYRPGDYCPDPLRFLTWDDTGHDVLRLARLMDFLGAHVREHTLEFPLSEADRQALHDSHPALPAAGSYVCLHPGARMPARRWPAARFAEVADSLHTAGLRVVLIGSAQETSLAAAVQENMQVSALNLTGKLSLGAFAALLAQARLLLCNESGIVQMAAALRIPSVALCYGNEARSWEPCDRRRHRSVWLASGAAGAAAATSLHVREIVRTLLADAGMPFA